MCVVAIKVLLLVAAVKFSNGSLSVRKIHVVGNLGDGEKRPIVAGESYSLRCDVTNDADVTPTYSSCTWKHKVYTDYHYDDESRDLEFACSGDLSTGNGKTCINAGDNALDGYASKISMDMTSSYCGIHVDNAEYMDNGDWECTVNSPGLPEDSRSLEVFVDNKIMLYYSDPDQMDDDTQTIVYQYNNENSREIKATCKAYETNTAEITKFMWYMDNDRNEIDTEFLTSDIREGHDGTAKYYEQTIRWAPTIYELCNDLNLKQEVCNPNQQANRNFDFYLICKVEQGSYEMAEITVEVVDIVETTDPSLAVSLDASTAASLPVSMATVVLGLVVAFRASLQFQITEDKNNFKRKNKHIVEPTDPFLAVSLDTSTAASLPVPMATKVLGLVVAFRSSLGFWITEDQNHLQRKNEHIVEPTDPFLAVSLDASTAASLLVTMATKVLGLVVAFRSSLEFWITEDQNYLQRKNEHIVEPTDPFLAVSLDASTAASLPVPMATKVLGLMVAFRSSLEFQITEDQNHLLRKNKAVKEPPVI